MRRSAQANSNPHRSASLRRWWDAENPDHKVIIIVLLMLTAANMFIGTYIRLRRISTSVASGICVILFGQIVIQRAKRRRQVRENRLRLERQALDSVYNHELAQFKRMGTVNQMLALSPDGFERFVLRYFHFAGYNVEMTPPNNDGGVDGIIRRGAFAGLIQCKRHVRPINQSPVREFLGVLTKLKADGGYFVTTSTFGPGAKRFANGTILTLIDGMTFTHMIQRLPYIDPSTGKPLTLRCVDESLPETTKAANH